MKTAKALVVLATALSSASLFADKIAFPTAPKSVQDAVKSRAGRNQVMDLERTIAPNGQVSYEAKWKENGVAQELVVSETGTIVRDVVGPRLGLAPQHLTLANKAQVALTDTPLAVQNAINNQLLGAKVDAVQKGIWNGQTIYEAAYQQNGRPATYQVSETGQPIVSQVPVTKFTPKYAGLAQSNVKLNPGVRMPFAQAPRPVQNTVNNLSNGARIENFQRGLWNDRNVYEASFKRNGQVTQLQILDDGTLLTAAPKAEAPPLPNVGSPPIPSPITVEP